MFVINIFKGEDILKKSEAGNNYQTGIQKDNFLSSMLKRSDTSVVAAMVILFVIFAIGSSSFLTPYNLFNVSRNAALYVFVAIGQALVLIVGGMNLSLGAIGGLSVVTAGFCMHVLGWPSWIAVVLALLVGMLGGYINGVIIVKLKLNAFVVTLATSFVFTGLVLGISKGFPYTKIPKSFKFIGTEGFLGVPYLFWLMIFLLSIVWFIFKYTVTGRRLLATGGNIDAARLSGIKTDKMILLANAASGFCAGVAGVLWVSRMGSAQPSIGTDWMIISFAVAVIGGTSLSGGSISSLGLFASSIMIALIKNGLIMMNVNVYFEQTFLGSIILLAVAIESFRLKYNSVKHV
jgi:ribose transport system permease protein